MRWLHLRWHAPLASFGGVMIDARGPTEETPGRSMVTGLIANALGWSRTMRMEMEDLQGRLVYGGIWECAPSGLRDYQTAQLGADDQVWTTRGRPQGRTGARETYDRPHPRWRDYKTDLRMELAIGLRPEDRDPTLERIGEALREPARPLSFGRRCCLPSAPMMAGMLKAGSLREALAEIAGEEDRKGFWPASEKAGSAERTVAVTDERSYRTGLHGGRREICIGRIERRAAA